MRTLLLIPECHTREMLGVNIDFDRYPDITKEAEDESSRLLGLVREAVSVSTLDFFRARFFVEGVFDGGVPLDEKYREIFPEARVEVTENYDAYYSCSALAQELVDLFAGLPGDQETENSNIERIKLLVRKIDEADQERNRVIAANINRALKEEETGILIIGAGHYQMLGMLADDIVVELFDPRMREFVEGALHGPLYDLLFGDETNDEKLSRLEDLDARYQVRREEAVG